MSLETPWNGLRNLKAIRISVRTFTSPFLAWQMALLVSVRGAWQGHSSIKGEKGGGGVEGVEGWGRSYSSSLGLYMQFGYRTYSARAEFA